MRAVGPELSSRDTQSYGYSTKSWRAMGVSIDTRYLREKELFIALKGSRSDGHAYLVAAQRAGAAAAMVEHIPANAPEDLPYLVVDNCLQALSDIALAKRLSYKGEVIAITGSVGKSSVKEFLRAGLSARGRVFANEGNLNNHIGVPLSLLRMDLRDDYGVFELGMNHVGEIASLSSLTRPKIAAITNICPVHSENFADISEIAESKAEIMSGMDADGILVLCREDAFFSFLSGLARDFGLLRVISFGRHMDADIRISDYSYDAYKGQALLSIEGMIVTCKLSVGGLHQLYNAAAALSIIWALNEDVQDSALNLSKTKLLRGRGNIISSNFMGKMIKVIDDSYNASPPSMRAALSLLSSLEVEKNGRRIAVLGDMLELGEKAADLHANLGAKILSAGIEAVFTIGLLSRNLHDCLPRSCIGLHADNVAELKSFLRKEIRANDVILVKGSNATGISEIVSYLCSQDLVAEESIDAI